MAPHTERPVLRSPFLQDFIKSFMHEGTIAQTSSTKKAGEPAFLVENLSNFQRNVKEFVSMATVPK